MQAAVKHQSCSKILKIRHADCEGLMHELIEFSFDSVNNMPLQEKGRKVQCLMHEPLMKVLS